MTTTLLALLLLGLPQDDPIEKAKELLKEAGYDDENPLPKITITYNTHEVHKRIAAAIQERWSEKLGIEVELRNQDWGTYLDSMSRIDYEVMRRGWVGDQLDATAFLDMFQSGDGNNNTGWSNDAYDTLLEKSRQEPDAAKRRAHLEAAEKLLIDEVPIIPLYFYVSHNMVKETVKGWHSNILDIHPLHRVVRGDGSDPLSIHNGAEVQTLDPNIMRGVPEYRVALAVFEGLCGTDPKTLEPTPGVAERWEISEDRKTYTFHLRDCTWEGGRPVTADDFVFSARRILKPETASDYAHLVAHHLKNGNAYYKWTIAETALLALEHGRLSRRNRRSCFENLRGACKDQIDRLKDLDVETKEEDKLLDEVIRVAADRNPPNIEDLGVRAVDAKTLVVELDHPTPYFLNLLGHFAFFPVPKYLVERHGDRWTRPEHIAGNGPFKLTAHEIGAQLTLARNPDYWDADNVKQEEVRFLPIERTTTAFRMYENGDIDILTDVPRDFVAALMDRDDTFSVPFWATYFYCFNVSVAPFDDVRVRRALSMVIDRKSICEKITGGGEVPAYHLVPPGLKDFKHPRTPGP